MSRAGTDYGSVSPESEVANGMADKDGEEDVSVVVHSEQHPECQRGSSDRVDVALM